MKNEDKIVFIVNIQENPICIRTVTEGGNEETIFYTSSGLRKLVYEVYLKNVHLIFRWGSLNFQMADEFIS